MVTAKIAKSSIQSNRTYLQFYGSRKSKPNSYFSPVMDTIVNTLVIVSVIIVPSFATELCPIGCECSTFEYWRDIVQFRNQMHIADCKNSNFSVIPNGLRPDLAALDMQNSSGLEGTLRNLLFSSSELSNLKIIALDDCSMTHIEDFAFQNVKGLIVLSLKYNHIESLNLRIFVATPNLQYLWLGGNPLKTFSGTEFAIGSIFKDLGLEECRLTSIPDELFSTMKELKILRLNGNKLTSVSVKLFLPLTNLRSLFLQKNPWNCDCHLKSLRAWLGKGELAFQLDILQCAEPPRLFNVSWDQLSPDDYICEGNDTDNFTAITNNADLLAQPGELVDGSTVWMFITIALSILSVVIITFLLFGLPSSRKFLFNKWRQLKNPTGGEVSTTPRACPTLNSPPSEAGSYASVIPVTQRPLPKLPNQEEGLQARPMTHYNSLERLTSEPTEELAHGKADFQGNDEVYGYPKIDSSM
jgi:hypothetical protein